MGREIEASNPPASLSEEMAAAPQTTSAAPSNPTNPSQLPPAALDLAAKLFDLARTGDTSALSTYLSAGVPPNLTNHNGDTLLMLACYHDQLDTARMLLDKGADPNVVNGRGQSIIAGSIFKGYEEVTRLLVESGADKNLGQPTAVQCARMFRRREVLEMLGESTEGLEDAGVGFGIPGMPGFMAPRDGGQGQNGAQQNGQ